MVFREGKKGEQSSLTMFKGKIIESWEGGGGGGGKGVVRILQSLMGKSGRLHCDTTKINQILM